MTLLEDGSASLDSIGCDPAAADEIDKVDSDPAAVAADAPSDDEVSGPVAASPSDVGLSAAAALGAESLAFTSPESQGPGVSKPLVIRDVMIPNFLRIRIRIATSPIGSRIRIAKSLF